MRIENGSEITNSSERRTWRAPTLTDVGTFGAVITGSLAVGTDTGPLGKNAGSDLDLKTDIETVERPLARLGRIRTD